MFHKWLPEYAENSIDKALKIGTLISDDAALIREFIAEIKATKGVCQGRANKLTFNIVAWRKYIGPFRMNSFGDLYIGIDRLNNARHDGKPYKRNTKRDLMLVLKRFYRWMIENQYSLIPEKKIKDIKAPGADRMTKTAAQLYDESEVRAMIGACQNSRDRCIIAVIWEAGLRVEEIGHLTWGQVKFDDFGVVLNVDEKTGRPRYIRIVGATQYLIAWKNDYPCTITPDAPVFLTAQKLPLEYGAIAMQLKKIGKRAGIKKTISPHLFRHSRITHMLQEGYSESVVKLTMWGRLDTTMFASYAHLGNADIDNEILEKQGIRRPETHRSDAMAVKQCASCNTVNPSMYDFCSACAEPLDETVRMSMGRLKQDIERTPEYKMIMGLARQKLVAGA
jgi:site-specific recombinase XerD